MDKIAEQQDRVITAEGEGVPKIIDTLGDQDTGIHPQRELEEQIARLEEERAILGPQLQDTLQQCSELEQRNTYLEAKVQEMSEQYQQAAVVIAQQGNQINQLNSELIVYLRQIIANQEAQIVQLQSAAE